MTGASIESTSEVWTSAISEWKYRIKKYDIEIAPNGMTSIMNLIEMY
jgi:hypothetical protein